MPDPSETAGSAGLDDVILPSRFKKSFNRKPVELRAAIAECVLRLLDNPRHPGLQTHRMGGHPGVWEAYVDKGNRVTFHYEDGELVFRNHCNHDMLRKNP
jgi:hypothetical protein